MATTIGVARITLYMSDTFSLKEKRGEVKSITRRVRNQFNAGIAEVADLDDIRVASLAVVCVSNNSAHADEMLANIIAYIERHLQRSVLGEIETELIHYGD